MKTVAIARAGADDLETQVALRCLLWDGDPAEHRAELQALSVRPSFAAFVARDGDTVIGFVEATLREYADGTEVGPPVAYLEGLFVVEGARRQGVATLLAAAVEDWAAREGCAEIASDADIENPDGIAWHAARGFEETGRTVNYARKLQR